MIITRFKGGIGNQLFQYAAVRKISLDSQVELKFDLSNQPYTREYGHAFDNLYALKFFNIAQNIVEDDEIRPLKARGFRFWLERIFLPRSKRTFIWEKNGRFDPDLIGLKRKRLYILGNFQSEAYFDGIQDILRKELTLKEPLDEKYRSIIEGMDSSCSVSVHIRRGDILRGNVKFEKTSMTAEYYKKAFDHMKTKLGAVKFFIFSDDIAWAKEHLDFLESKMFVSAPYMRDYEELILMSRCKHNIIGNSTFSWWGGMAQRQSV